MRETSEISPRGIFLSDPQAKLLPYLISLRIRVELLIVASETIKQNVLDEYYSSDVLNQVLTLADAMTCSDFTGVERDILEFHGKNRYRYVNSSKRYFHDYQYINFSWFASLEWWSKKFSALRPAAAVHVGFIHGVSNDLVMLDEAVRRNLPAFYIPKVAENHVGYRYLMNHRSGNSVFLDNYNSTSFESDFYKSKKKQNEKTLKKEVLKKIGYFAFECLATPFKWRIDFHGGSKELTFIKNYSNKLVKLKLIFEIRLIREFLRKFEVERSEIPDKYIYYPLHFEPEATLFSPLIENQMAVVKIICNALPEGWFLVVKEHPHQFQINTRLRNYFIWSLPIFKTKYFYRALNAIDSVVIVDSSASSEMLIDGSRCVATINGTVIFESLLRKKPVFRVGNGANIFPGDHSWVCPNFFTSSEVEEFLQNLRDLHNHDKEISEWLKELSRSLVLADDSGWRCLAGSIKEEIYGKTEIYCLNSNSK